MLITHHHHITSNILKHNNIVYFDKKEKTLGQTFFTVKINSEPSRTIIILTCTRV